MRLILLVLVSCERAFSLFIRLETILLIVLCEGKTHKSHAFTLLRQQVNMVPVATPIMFCVIHRLFNVEAVKASVKF